MAKLQPVRGTHDLLPDAWRAHQHVIATAREIVGRYGFASIDTPIFEFTDVFARGIGEATDVVMKEMYTFDDKGGDSITLRPEATAGVMRAVLSQGLQQELPLRLFCAGPMFRYERPQKGRQRQFHQINAELIGVPEPAADVEVIAAAAHVLDTLGVTTTLQLNTLGDGDSRAAYRAVLVEYFADHLDALSDDSRDRLNRNPLRILDSKDPADQAVVAEAPRYGDYLTDAARQFYAAVRAGLDDLGIAYTQTEHLVRGLDYYGHTAFEFVTDALGAQGTVLGGGRYDGLAKLMGGPEIPGVGWAGGIERLALLAAGAPPAPRPIALVAVGDAGQRRAQSLAAELRHGGLSVDLAYRGNLSRRMKRANKLGARAAVIVGDDEIARDTAVVRDLDSGEQTDVPFAGLAGHLQAFR